MTRKAHFDGLLFGAAFVATVVGGFSVWNAGYASPDNPGFLIPLESVKHFMVLVLGALIVLWFRNIAVTDPEKRSQRRLRFGEKVGNVFKAPFHFLVRSVASGSPRQRKTLAWISFFVTSALLILVFVPGIGIEIRGARRWIGLPGTTIQPSEFAKLATLALVAYYLSVHKPWQQPKVRDLGDRIGRIWIPKLARSWWLFFGVGAMVLFILKQPDLDTALTVALIALGLMAIGGVSWKSILTLVFLGGSLAVHQVVTEPFRMERFSNHFHRWDESVAQSHGFQPILAETGLARGGLTGEGLTDGQAKYTLPVPTSDYILVTIGEEFGLIGSLSVLLLLGFLTFRLYWQGMRRTDMYQKLFLCGISIWIGVQTCINVLMVNAILPPIGVPLPFISAGATGLLTLWIAVALAEAIVCTPEAQTETDPRPRYRSDRAAVTVLMRDDQRTPERGRRRPRRGAVNT